jgi:hypothetical protein
MANSKLSALTSASFAGGDLIYIVQGGNSRKASIGARAAALLDDTGQTQALTTLGGTTVGRGVFTAATAAAALTALGIPAFPQTVLDDTGQTTVLTTLGGTSIGRTVFRASTAWTALASLGVGRGTDLASAATLNLDSIDSLLVNVTGVVTVTAVTLTSTHWRIVRATGAFQITAGASLIVNGSTTVNMTTVAGDLLLFEGYDTGVVRVWLIGNSGRGILPGLGSASQLLRVNSGGSALEYFTAAATQAEQETGTSTSAFVTPGRQQFHASAAKFWGYVTVSAGTPTLQTSYNVTSITDTGTGLLTVTIATDFSSANWPAFVTGNEGTQYPTWTTNSKAVGSILLQATYRASGTTDTFIDPDSWEFGGFRDQ